MTVVALAPEPTVDERIRAEIVEDLREMLTRAEAGEITGMLLIVKHPDGRWSDRRSGVMDMPEAIGFLTITLHQWIKDWRKHQHEGA